MKKLIILIALLFVSSVASAEYFLVNDMSQIKYQMGSGGRVYFRNLNDFDGRYQGCCYNYYLDTNTEGGKVMWSTMLSAMAMRQSLYIHANPVSPSPITHIGVY